MTRRATLSRLMTEDSLSLRNEFLGFGKKSGLAPKEPMLDMTMGDLPGSVQDYLERKGVKSDKITAGYTPDGALAVQAGKQLVELPVNVVSTMDRGQLIGKLLGSKVGAILDQAPREYHPGDSIYDRMTVS